MKSSARPQPRYANLSFRVSPHIKDDFALLSTLHQKKGVEMFSMLVEQALQMPLTNVQLRSLPQELRATLIARQSQEASSICEKFAAEFAIDDLSDDLPDDEQC